MSVVRMSPPVDICSPGKNAAFLRVVRCRSLAEENSVDTFHKDTISE